MSRGSKGAEKGWREGEEEEGKEVSHTGTHKHFSCQNCTLVGRYKRVKQLNDHILQLRQDVRNAKKRSKSTTSSRWSRRSTKAAASQASAKSAEEVAEEEMDAARKESDLLKAVVEPMELEIARLQRQLQVCLTSEKQIRGRGGVCCLLCCLLCCAVLCCAVCVCACKNNYHQGGQWCVECGVEGTNKANSTWQFTQPRLVSVFSKEKDEKASITSSTSETDNLKSLYMKQKVAALHFCPSFPCSSMFYCARVCVEGGGWVASLIVCS